MNKSNYLRSRTRREQFTPSSVVLTDEECAEIDKLSADYYHMDSEAWLKQTQEICDLVKLNRNNV